MKAKSLTVILKDSIGEASTTALDIFAERTGIRVLNQFFGEFVEEFAE